MDEITQGVDAEGVHPVGRGRLREGAKKGYKYPFPFVDLEFELHFGKYHDVDSSQDAFYAVPLEAFRDAREGGHHAAGADHEGGGGLARSSTRARSPATSTAVAA